MHVDARHVAGLKSELHRPAKKGRSGSASRTVSIRGAVHVASETSSNRGRRLPQVFSAAHDGAVGSDFPDLLAEGEDHSNRVAVTDAGRGLSHTPAAAPRSSTHDDLAEASIDELFALVSGGSANR